jgi:NAD(P)-dependent dehydrogenase (short-subunit alcohol dehydrogenase family)
MSRRPAKSACGRLQRAEQTVPLKRAGRLREAGFLALYLASAASDYMAGQKILLDRGLAL